MRYIYRLALVLAALAVLALGGLPALASDVSDAEYRGEITVTNSSYSTSREATYFNLFTTALIDGGYVDADLQNLALTTTGGADVAFMPALAGGDDKWFMYVDTIGQNTSVGYYLYAGGPDMGGQLAYFPGVGGMTAADAASLELGDDFEIELSGVFDTSAGADKNLVVKGSAFQLYVSGENEITAQIPGTEALDQSQINTGAMYSIYGVNWVSQGFLCGSTGRITKVDIGQSKNGNPTGNVNFSIYATSGGYPTGSPLITEVIPIGSWSSSVTFTDDLILTSGVVYAWVASLPDGDASNFINFLAVNTNDYYPEGTGRTTGNSGVSWTGLTNNGDFYFKTYSAPLAIVSATGVSSGEHIIQVVSDGVDLELIVDSVVEDTTSAIAVPDNANGWTYVENDSALYIDYLKTTVDSTLVQHIAWEFDTTFTDLTLNSNDTTPTFRTTLSDNDVTAVLNDLLPLGESFTGSAEELTPELVTEIPLVPPEFYTELNTDHLPGGELINDMLEGAGIPLAAFWFPLIFGGAGVLSLAAYGWTRDLFPSVSIATIVVVFFGLTGAIPLWTLIPLLIIFFGELVRRRTLSL